MDLFDEPMKIPMLASLLAGRMWEEQERANKLQATLNMMSEQNARRRQISPETISALKAKEREIASLKFFKACYYCL